MGEQPIFTCQAHVFHIDPKTKRTWITASMKAVSVSFFYDSSRNLYRIISVEGTKAVINSTITPNMTFTQTSQKFGQWSDVRANTVYGLGFASEAELTKFVEKFQEVKEATKNAMKSANGSAAVTPTASANTSPISSRMQQNDNTAIDPHTVEPPNMTNTNTQNANPDSPSHKLLPAADVKQDLGASASPSPAPAVTVSSGGSIVGVHTGGGAGATGEQQLKYENERLKMALAQSCANAKKWEIELATLKNNNIRLTSALQESTANVDEWKRQLHTYKEENIRLKREMDMIRSSGGGAVAGASGGGEIAEDLRREIGLLKGRIESLENELMSQEIELKAANMSLRDKTSDQNMAKLSELNVLFAKHLSELFSVQKDMENVSEAEQQQQQQQLAAIKKYCTVGDTESTLSNVTSIQSQLQSLNEPCDDTLKMYEKLQTYASGSSSGSAQMATAASNYHQQLSSEQLIRSQVLKAMNKHSVLLQELHKRQTQAAASRKTNLAAANLLAAAGAIPNSTQATITHNNNTNTTQAAVGVATVVSPSKSGQLPSGSGKTATILVSKSKTKTGLPLLLKNSINN